MNPASAVWWFWHPSPDARARTHGRSSTVCAHASIMNRIQDTYCVEGVHDDPAYDATEARSGKRPRAGQLVGRLRGRHCGRRRRCYRGRHDECRDRRKARTRWQGGSALGRGLRLVNEWFHSVLARRSRSWHIKSEHVPKSTALKPRQGTSRGNQSTR